MKAFQALLAESKRVGWPASYDADLTTHDRNRLRSEDAPETFGWVLRECGTLLLDSRMPQNSRAGYLEHLRGCSNDRCYFWNGSTLQTVTRDRMGELMRPHAEPEKTGMRGAY